MNAQQAWQATLGQLQMEMPKASFDTWVRNAEVVTNQGNTFIIGVHNAYARDWLESRLTSTVSHILSGIMDHPQSVRFVVSNNGHPLDLDEETEDLEDEDRSISTEERNTVNERYTFDNFVVGACNRLAHAACLAVAENPANAYNPLFLYGGVGQGKTHLLHAIGNMVRQELNVLYVSSEEFTNDFITSVRTHTPVAFRERYRTTDVLMIDDIQFLANKEQTQEEFFHTFNTLHSQNKQIVISSDRPPKAMVTLEERLRSRFEWGLIADIQPADLETRIAILRSKAERAGRQVDGEILEFIARKIQSNNRELEGALTRVLAFSDLRGEPITNEMIGIALVDLLPQSSSIDADDVMSAVANAYNITLTQLLGRNRSREFVLPRQVVMYLMRQEANASLPQIGQALGGRDHTTVMHGCEKVADLIERDDRLRRQVLQIRQQLYAMQPAQL
jgi:chromosomal replication initiator protein